MVYIEAGAITKERKMMDEEKEIIIKGCFFIEGLPTKNVKQPLRYAKIRFDMRPFPILNSFSSTFQEEKKEDEKKN